MKKGSCHAESYVSLQPPMDMKIPPTTCHSDRGICLFLKTEPQKRIPRSARDDSVRVFFISLPRKTHIQSSCEQLRGSLGVIFWHFCRHSHLNKPFSDYRISGYRLLNWAALSGFGVHVSAIGTVFLMSVYVRLNGQLGDRPTAASFGKQRFTSCGASPRSLRRGNVLLHELKDPSVDQICLRKRQIVARAGNDLHSDLRSHVSQPTHGFSGVIDSFVLADQEQSGHA